MSCSFVLKLLKGTLAPLLSIFLTVTLPFSARAASRGCSGILLKSESARDLSKLAIEQMMIWEETSNTKAWHKPTTETNIEVASAKYENVKTLKVGEVGSIAKMILAKEVYWPKHPWNSDPQVPHYYSPVAAEWKIRYSASRSTFLYTPEGDLYSIKAPTNNPHNMLSQMQPPKADLSSSLIISHRRSEMVHNLRSRSLQVDENFEFLLDVLSVVDRSTGNGYVVRDLRPLQDGRYNLPAFSVPYAGREIAAKARTNFDVFWGKHWAALVGRSKASLLLNYGLEMKTPNAQNMLIQLDREFVPTGKMFFRDISDSSLVGPVAESLGLSKQLEEDQKSGFRISDKLNPDWTNSAWQMDEGGIGWRTLERWGRIHDRAYIDYIAMALSNTASGANLFAGIFTITALQKALFSVEGRNAMKEYAGTQKQMCGFEYLENDNRLDLQVPAQLEELKKKFLGTRSANSNFSGPSLPGLQIKFSEPSPLPRSNQNQVLSIDELREKFLGKRLGGNSNGR